MTKISRIGIICEDKTDYLAVKTLIRRIIGDQYKISFRPKSGGGCGNLKNKCNAWSRELKVKKCDLLVVVHDSDGKNAGEIEADLKARLKDSPILNRYISVPIQELEAWFLGDPDGIKNAYSLMRAPKIKGLPETIDSPKDYLGEIIYLCSNKEVIYTPSHNELIAANVSIDNIKQRSSTFELFFNFIISQKYKA